MKNKILHKAKKNKQDEFYTQYSDIKKELIHYKKHFKDKVVYCNCDKETSNFVKYFKDNSDELQIKEILYSYYDDINQSGDFRSRESLELLIKADIVVTNPPFSLFREFVSLMVEYNKKFLIIGNINCITYKEIFSLIKDNKVWLGVNMGRGISGFIVPDEYELFGSEVKIDEEGNKIISTNSCLWLTNLDLDKRYQDIKLDKLYYGNEDKYLKFDNYDAINVNKTKDIPLDYKGTLGVPITFLHKFNPNQFEIIKFRKGDDNKDLSINGKCPYFRILIKPK